MVVVEAFAAGHPGQQRRVVRRVLEVLSPAPVTATVDERREDEDVEDGVRRRGNQAGPNAEGEVQERDAEPEPAP